MTDLWRTKEFWFAVLYGIVSVAGLFGFASWQPDGQTLEVIGIIVAVVTVLLRYARGSEVKRISSYWK